MPSDIAYGDAIARAAAPRHDYNAATLDMVTEVRISAVDLIVDGNTIFHRSAYMGITERRQCIGKMRIAMDRLNEALTALEAAECASLGHSVAA